MSLVESETSNVRPPDGPELDLVAGPNATPAPNGDAPIPEPVALRPQAPPQEFDIDASGVVPSSDAAEHAPPFEAPPPPIAAAPVITVARTISIGATPPPAAPLAPDPDPSPAPAIGADYDFAFAPELAPVPPAAYIAPQGAASPEPFPATFAQPALDAPLAAAFSEPTNVPVFADAPANHVAASSLDESARPLEGSFERYQRLFAETERPGVADNAILAALDAAVHPTSTEPAVPAANPAAAFVQPPAASLPEPPANLDLERDVDWAEPPETATQLLGRVAKAIPLAEVPAAVGGSFRESSRPPSSASARAPAGRIADSSEYRAPVRAKSIVDDERDPDSTGPNSDSRRKSRKRGGRSRSDSSSALLIFSFVASVILALGTGFVAGFVVGRGSPNGPDSQKEPAPGDGTAKRTDSAAAESAPNEELEIVKNPSEPAAVPAGSAVSNPAAAAALAANRPAKASAEQKSSTFDQKSAGAALSKAQARAGLCVQPGEPGGTAVATVTFDPSGSTSHAAVYGARFAGTPAGECMVKMLRDLKVRPFTGDPVTVKKTISVE